MNSPIPHGRLGLLRLLPVRADMLLRSGYLETDLPLQASGRWLDHRRSFLPSKAGVRGRVRGGSQAHARACTRHHSTST